MVGEKRAVKLQLSSDGVSTTVVGSESDIAIFAFPLHVTLT